MRISSWWNFLLVGITAAALSGCNSAAEKDGSSATGNTSATAGEGESFSLGMAAPFTGDSSEFGAQMRMGVELFADEVNAAGGINGRTLVMNFQDDAGETDQAQNVATVLASDDSVLAVVGHFNSSCSLAGKGLYTSAKMVMFSPASTNVEVTKNSDYIFRNIFTDDFQGQSLATYVGQTLAKKNVAILFDNDDYGTGLKDSFKKKATEFGMTIVSAAAYSREAPDFRSQLTALQSVKPVPDVILIAGLYTQAANIARQARDLGINTQIVAGDGVFSQQYITLAGPAAEGSFITCPFLFDLGGEKATKFAEAFRKKFSKDPDAWAALSYDAISMICDGLKKNGFTREAVLTHLKSINSSESANDGLTGKTFFDAEGDCKKAVQVAAVRGGKFVAAEKQLTATTNQPSAAPSTGPAAGTAQTTAAQ